jgi:membrane associated rhomboid family serine protease
MLYGLAPKWLEKLERLVPGLAVPNLALYLVGAQVLGFVLVLFEPKSWEFLPLVPALVLHGEVWRLVSFLAVPLSMSPIWMVFVLYFLYFIVNGIENEWGSFKTTVYVLVCILLTVAFSFATGWTITTPAHLESTLFFAAATIAPEYQILLFFILPVKLKWVAWISLAYVAWAFAVGGWLERLYLTAIYANYLLFFGPYLAWQVKQWERRRQFKHAQRDEPDEE